MTNPLGETDPIDLINAHCEDGTIRIENPLEEVIDPKTVNVDCRSCRCTAVIHN